MHLECVQQKDNKNFPRYSDEAAAGNLSAEYEAESLY